MPLCSGAELSPEVRQSEQDTEASNCCRKTQAGNVQQLLGESSATRRIVQGLHVCVYVCVCICKWVRVGIKSR